MDARVDSMSTEEVCLVVGDWGLPKESGHKVDWAMGEV